MLILRLSCFSENASSGCRWAGPCVPGSRLRYVFLFCSLKSFRTDGRDEDGCGLLFSLGAKLQAPSSSVNLPRRAVSCPFCDPGFHLNPAFTLPMSKPFYLRHVAEFQKFKFQELPCCGPTLFLGGMLKICKVGFERFFYYSINLKATFVLVYTSFIFKACTLCLCFPVCVLLEGKRQESQTILVMLTCKLLSP